MELVKNTANMARTIKIMITEQVTINLKILGPLVKFDMACNRNCTPVLTVQRSWSGDENSNFLKQASKPNHFRSSVRHSSILSFWSGMETMSCFSALQGIRVTKKHAISSKEHCEWYLQPSQHQNKPAIETMRRAGREHARGCREGYGESEAQCYELCEEWQQTSWWDAMYRWYLDRRW